MGAGVGNDRRVTQRVRKGKINCCPHYSRAQHVTQKGASEPFCILSSSTVLKSNDAGGF